IAVMPGLDGGLQPRTMVERKQDVGNRRGVGHGGYSARTGEGDTLPYHETTGVSMGRWRQHRALRRQIPRVFAGGAGNASTPDLQAQPKTPTDLIVGSRQRVARTRAR